MKFIKNYGGREKYFQVKFKKDLTSDCVVRAIAIANDMDYLTVMAALFGIGLKLGQMPNNKKCYDVYLERLGWTKHSPLKDSRNRKFKVCNAPFDRNERYIVHTTKHLTAVVNGVLNDSWNCQNSTAYSYYTKNKH